MKGLREGKEGWREGGRRGRMLVVPVQQFPLATVGKHDEREKEREREREGEN